MTDTKKRKTLKLIAGTGALAMGTALFPAIAKSDSTNLGLSIQHNPYFDSNYFVINNPTNQEVTVKFESMDFINSPSGRLNLDNLSAQGPIKLSPQGSKVIDLTELGDEFLTPNQSDKNQGHFALRFPIRDNVVIDHVKVISDNCAFNARAPVYLAKTASMA